ncbi:MAG TPA: response regulator [Syntrophaceae bacterium]|nr:response regulator [Syntrophaceae bacterium]
METDKEMRVDLFTEGIKNALICENDEKNLGLITNALESLDYKVMVATSAQDVEEKLQFVHYDIIILNEAFGGETGKDNAILRYLNTIPMTIRRDMLVVFVGKDFRTLDHMAAFANSVNVVVNIDHLKDIQSILKTSITHHEKFYKVFKDYLKEAGRA